MPDAPRLTSPMFIPPGTFAAFGKRLLPREVGALVLIAGAWWPDGRLPAGAELGRVLGMRTSSAEALMRTLRPYFESGGMFALLRGAALAKRDRRARAGRMGAAATLRRRTRVERPERMLPPRLG